jgi:hypothetical protein
VFTPAQTAGRPENHRRADNASAIALGREERAG